MRIDRLAGPGNFALEDATRVFAGRYLRRISDSQLNAHPLRYIGKYPNLIVLHDAE
jgi:hypothetical protein